MGYLGLVVDEIIDIVEQQIALERSARNAEHSGLGGDSTAGHRRA